MTFMLNPGDLIVGDDGSPLTISVVNPQTLAKTVVCNCTAFNPLKDVAVKSAEKIYAIGQLLNANAL